MRVASCHFRRFFLAALLLALVYCVCQVLRRDLGFNDVAPFSLEKLNGVPACKLPELDISSPEIMKFIKDVPPLKCTADEDWVMVNGSKLIIKDKAKERHGPITCSFNEIIRVDDFSIKRADTVESDDSYVLKQSDFVEVKCESHSEKQWHSVLAGVKEDQEVMRKVNWDYVPSKALKLNVLMFGFDSLSRNTFVRKLPKTYRYLKQSLNTLVLEGYNIVGDGTPQALIPILTGKIELELPDVRTRMGSKANYVDVYPMIWKKYKENGYITGFMEDVYHIGTFTYRLKGFNKQPTDHYMRPYYMAAAPFFKYYKKFCMGGIPRHLVMMNYIKSIFNVYQNQPKFVFGFHGELSHDSYNDIGVADEDLYRWVKELHDSNHLNNTILILMSDHGHRFAEIRNTLQGKQEERLPFFSFTFPPWFKQVYPHAYANFVYNTRYLTTPFDIHKTLETILNFKTPEDGDRTQRAISLFDKIPLERTCNDAFIEPHWCACLAWKEVSTDDPIARAAADHFIQFLNDYTENYRDVCEVLRVNKILWSMKLIPTKGLLNFQKSADKDGYVGDFTAKTELMSEMYQVKVETEPGGGLFEASMNYDVKRKKFTTKITDVSRINKYGSQARCVENSLFHLRKYCYCKG